MMTRLWRFFERITLENESLEGGLGKRMGQREDWKTRLEGELTIEESSRTSSR